MDGDSALRVHVAAFFTLLCMAAVVSLVVAERRGVRRARAISKTLASACFIAVAGCFWGSRSGAGDWLVVGLVLGAVGDVALLGSGQRAFLIGLSAFLLGHVAYVVGFSVLSAPTNWVGASMLGVGAFGAIVLRWLWRRLGPMRIPVVLYVGVLCVMVVAALSVAAQHRPYGAGVAAGAVLFALSDVSVARDRFVVDAFANKAWGLPTYYAGQLILAWAVGYAVGS